MGYMDDTLRTIAEKCGLCGATNCIAHGTLIETAAGQRPVETVSVGDKLWGYDPDKREPVIVKVTKLTPSSARETIRVGALRVTTDHLVFANGDWKPAGEFQAKENLLGSDLKNHVTSQIELVSEPVEVFDIKVEQPHNFFAGDVLVRG